jgi:hypothetical protein
VVGAAGSTKSGVEAFRRLKNFDYRDILWQQTIQPRSREWSSTEPNKLLLGYVDMADLKPCVNAGIGSASNPHPKVISAGSKDCAERT